MVEWALNCMHVCSIINILFFDVLISIVIRMKCNGLLHNNMLTKILKYLFNCFYSAHIGSYQTAYKAQTL